MEKLREILAKITGDEAPEKLILSKPAEKASLYKKTEIHLKKEGYQIAKYTEKQVFHENIKATELGSSIEKLCEESGYRQINGFSASWEHIVLISKKGECNYKRKKRICEGAGNCAPASKAEKDHNRSKNYLISEGQQAPPLVDMGIFTKDGKVVRSMYDKFRQINRFLEILDDEIASKKRERLNIIDFGCGKSYLTFVVYYYLTEIRKVDAHIIGLDLKADVIAKCNAAAKKYGYKNLSFEMGDINGYQAPFDVDMVLTLHACDTATDYALYNAIQWNAEMIFSVPCCQHELNAKVKSDDLSILTGRYGIIKERFSALATDAIRGNLLEYAGYKTQLLEFIDLEHTPKNILIRAVRRPVTPKGTREKALAEVEALLQEFHTSQTLYDLLIKKE